MKESDASQGQSASELISKRIAELGDWRGETLSRMRKLIKEADPDVVEVDIHEGEEVDESFEESEVLGQVANPSPQWPGRRSSADRPPAGRRRDSTVLHGPGRVAHLPESSAQHQTGQ